jgi:hypothetical protein
LNVTINTKQLRASLPKLVERVRKGARFTVIYRSRPAFQIVPVDATEAARTPLETDPLYRARAARDAALEEATWLVTTDYVIDETLTLIRMRLGLVAAEAWWGQLDGSARVRWEWIDPLRADRARGVFFRHRDKDYSFTDCTSFALMRELKLGHALTTDHHFRQMGFQVLPWWLQGCGHSIQSWRTKSCHAHARTPGATARVAAGVFGDWCTRCNSTVVPGGRFLRSASASRCIGPAMAGVTVRAALHSTSDTPPPRPGMMKSTSSPCSSRK